MSLMSMHLFPDFYSSFLINWILENKIIDVLFDKELMHCELFKRSDQMFTFLAQNDKLEQKVLLMLWEASQKCGSDVQEAVYDILKELCTLLSLSDLNFLRKKVEEVPLQEYTSITLSLLKQLTVNAMDHPTKVILRGQDDC